MQKRRIILSLCAILVAAVAILWWLVITEGLLWRRQYGREFDLVLTDGRTARVELRGSRGRAIGGHVFHYGGVREQTQVTLFVDEDTYAWRGTTEEPIIVDSISGQLFLVLETYEPGDPQAAFSVLAPEHGSWREIPPTDLPRQIARQNIGLRAWGADEQSYYDSSTKRLRSALERARLHAQETRRGAQH